MTPRNVSPLRYTHAGRSNATAKRHYLRWREQQNPPMPVRCDEPLCRYHAEPLRWNGESLPLILEHVNGVNSDNRPRNLRLLCPNCDAQNLITKGGANRGRVKKDAGGFRFRRPDGSRAYVLPAEPGQYVLMGQSVGLTGPDGSRR